MTDAKTLARYLLYLLKERMKGLQSEEFDVTPLKLQKLLYYCQGYALALTGRPVFSEPIEAWKYGPVVNSVYQEYKRYKGGYIPYGEITPPAEIDEGTAAIARMVVSEKGRLSGIALADATHKERPWRESFDSAYANKIIPLELLRDSFIDELASMEAEGTEEEEDALWESASSPVTEEDWEGILADV